MSSVRSHSTTMHCVMSTATAPQCILSCPVSTVTLPHCTLSCPVSAASLPHCTLSCPVSAANLPQCTLSCPVSAATLPQCTLSCPQPLPHNTRCHVRSHSTTMHCVMSTSQSTTLLAVMSTVPMLAVMSTATLPQCILSCPVSAASHNVNCHVHSQFTMPVYGNAQCRIQMHRQCSLSCPQPFYHNELCHVQCPQLVCQVHIQFTMPRLMATASLPNAQSYVHTASATKCSLSHRIGLAAVDYHNVTTDS